MRRRWACRSGCWRLACGAASRKHGGTLAGAPVERLQKTLALDAHQPLTLDLAGSAAWEVRDFAKAALNWRRLLERLPAGDSRRAELDMAVRRAEQRARLGLPSPPWKKFESTP